LDAVIAIVWDALKRVLFGAIVVCTKPGVLLLRLSFCSQRAVLLIMNAILGSGILGQAYAMRHSGWAVFVASLVVMCGAAAYGAWLLLCCCETANVTSYEEVGQKSLGNLGHRLATAAILVQNTAAMTSYLVILGDVLPPLIQEAAGIERGTEDVPFFANRTFIMATVSALVILPLVSLRHISALGYSSGLSIFIMVVFAAASGSISTSVPCPLPADRLPSGSPTSQQCAAEPVSIGIDTFYVIPSIAFAFVCHTALLPVYTELKDRSKQRMMQVTGTAMFACSILYLAAGERATLDCLLQCVQVSALGSCRLPGDHCAFVVATRPRVCLCSDVWIHGIPRRHLQRCAQEHDQRLPRQLGHLHREGSGLHQRHSHGASDQLSGT
jgi:hypothetical protein